MRAVDPRLLRRARAARTQLARAVVLGVVVAGLIVAQAALLAHALSTAAVGTGVRALAGTLAALLAVVAARAAATYGGETAALRAAARVKSQLRRTLIGHSVRLGPDWLERQQPGRITVLATRGLDALDPYFARFLPQVVLSVLVPAAVVVTVTATDWVSGVVIIVTLPLIPLFATLVGLHTKAQTRRQWRLLSQLSGHFLDVVQGLPTLKVFGRAKAQEQVIADVTRRHRSAAMATLRVAFLSSLVLELSAALATALVAVETGLRLLYGHLSYQSALLVLLLTPEAYLPLRAAAAQYHAGAEGAAAAESVFEILETPVPLRSTQPTGEAPLVGTAHRDPAPVTISFDGVTVTYTDRDAPALAGVDLAIGPGELIVLTGPSGAGKTTMLRLLLKFVEPDGGTIRVGGTDLAAVPSASWRAGLAWVSQHPRLFSGSVADNIALGLPGASRTAVEDAARLAGAAAFIEALPRGYDTPLAQWGAQLSTGQRQQLALARALLRDAPLLLLDEPTAHLAPAAAAAVRAVVTDLVPGRTVVVATHQRWEPAGLTQVIALDAGRRVTPAPLADAATPAAER